MAQCDKLKTQFGAGFCYLDQPVKLMVPYWELHGFDLQSQCFNLIGQPGYKSREVLRKVVSLAGTSALATLPPLEGPTSLGPPRLRNLGDRGMEVIHS